MNLLATLAALCGLAALIATATSYYHANCARNLRLQNDALRQERNDYRISLMAVTDYTDMLEQRRHVILSRWWRRSTYRRLSAIPTRRA